MSLEYDILCKYLLILLLCIITVHCMEEFENVCFTNSWAVHIENGDQDVANEIAEKHGFLNLGQIGSLPGYFHFMHNKEESRRHRREVSTLLSEEKIKWVEQQQVLEREKRSVVPEYVPAVHPTGYSAQDPLYSDQWYLNNVGQSNGPPSLDINVLPVWSRGISGNNIVVAILDDGLDHTHPDLRRNYDPKASYDFNDYDEDPMPRDSDPNNCHGTKCAGEVAAEAGNGVCGIGVAFNSSIAGIRMLDGNVTDTIEGGALSYKKDYIDIYSCAWGPKDDGKRFGRPGTLASKALELGVREGRNGLGSIFIWATGNGGLTDDDCNCDGYTTSVYTVSIGAISDHGLSTYYTESCSSTLAVTYSGGSHREKRENKIITTTLNHKCSSEFKGTSSAAPLAAGMVALMLEANGNLTWRDVQHVIVETSLMTSPLDEGWRRNGAGKWFNQKFGFGRMDAAAMIDKAQNWKNVNSQRQCWSDTAVGPWNIPSSGTLVVSVNSSACADSQGQEVKSLEHVQVILTLKHRHRGHLSIELISPSGTRTRLLKTRRNDKSIKGLKDWVFMSVHFWGEDPHGVWTLAVTDNNQNTRQHHRIKSRYGDLEDATQIIQDEMDQKNDDGDGADFKTSEELEDGIFKDDTFRVKHNKHKSQDNQDSSIKDTTATIMQKLRDKNILQKLNENGRNINKERIRKKLQKHRMKSKRKKGHKDNADQSLEDDDSIAEKILEEILKGINSSDTDQKTMLSSTTEKPSSQFTDSSTTQSSASHTSSTETPSLRPSTTFDDTSPSSSTTPSQSTSTTTTKPNTTESKMLENILHSVVSQVFGDFFSEKDGVKSFGRRLSALEAILGQNSSDIEDDPLVSSLQNAFKSGKAIDRVNNVLAVLENGKNQTKFANSSFPKNADVVIDVLKVLKDVLSAKKDNKNLEDYKERISNVLETQSTETQKLTEKLLRDLRENIISKNNNNSNSGIVDDALALITQIFQNRQRQTYRDETKESGRKPMMYEFTIGNNDNNDQDTETLSNLPTASVTDNQKEITTTRSSKEILHDDNHVERITVVHTNVKKQKPKQRKNKKKIGDALHFTSSQESDDNSSMDRSTFYENGRSMKKGGNSLTINVMKVGKETAKEREFEDPQVMNLLSINEQREADFEKHLNSDYENTADFHKKTIPSSSNPLENGNIDIEVLVDGKDQVTTRSNTVDLSHGANGPEYNQDQKPHHIKKFHLKVNEDLVPKSLTYDMAKKKTTVTTPTSNKGKNKNKGEHARRIHDESKKQMMEKDFQGDPFSFVQFTDPPEQSIPLLPGEMSESFGRPASYYENNAGNFPGMKYFDAFLPPEDTEEKASFYGDDEEQTSRSDFEFPYTNTNFELTKRSNVFEARNSDEFFDNSYPPFGYQEQRDSIPFPQNLDNGFDILQNQGALMVYRKNVLPETKGRENYHGEVNRHVRKKKSKISINDIKSNQKHVISKRQKNKQHRSRRSIEDSMDDTTYNISSTSVRKKRNVIDEDDDYDDDEGDDGPHVVKRSAIFSELYPSKIPLVVNKESMFDDEKADNDEEGNIEETRSDIEEEFYTHRNNEKSNKIAKSSANRIGKIVSGTIKNKTIEKASGKDETTSVKRSAIEQALSLENSLRKKLVSMRKESSSVLEVIKRVHTDIVNSDSKDLRILEKELSSLESKPSAASLLTKSSSANEKNTNGEEKFIKMLEQNEKSSLRDDITTITSSSEDGKSNYDKQNPDEYYKYGTSTSGILMNWTLKFYGT